MGRSERGGLFPSSHHPTRLASDGLGTSDVVSTLGQLETDWEKSKAITNRQYIEVRLGGNCAFYFCLN